jgi:DNA-binding FadR family transcriptional regulator
MDTPLTNRALRAISCHVVLQLEPLFLPANQVLVGSLRPMPADASLNTSVQLLQPILDVSRNQLIQERLREYITRNRLHAGDRLPTEDQLTIALGVSRSAVREALRAMEAVGLVEARQGSGRVVAPFTFDLLLKNVAYGLTFDNATILQLTELRKALDAYFIELAIRNITDEDIAELGRLVLLMKQHAAAGEPINDEDHPFHETIFRLCGNPLILQLFEITWSARQHAIDQMAATHEISFGTADEHAAILEAIKHGDAATARALLVAHQWNAEQRFREHLDLPLEQADQMSISAGGM